MTIHASAQTLRPTAVPQGWALAGGRIPTGPPHRPNKPRAARTAAPTRLTARASSAEQSSASTTSTVRMATQADCRLAISIYPSFTYNASGGGGTATAAPAGSPSAPPLPPSVPPPPPGALAVAFDPARLAIPALDWRTTRFLGLPLPPGLEIAIKPLTLAGWVDRSTGRVALAFDAAFQFSAFGLYRPPVIPVETLLSTEGVAGEQLAGQGARLDAESGKARLAGVSRVPLNDAFLSWFLRLPADCLAEMVAEFEFE